MNSYEELQAAKDARLLAQTPIPVHTQQRRKGIRRPITVEEVLSIRKANGIQGGLSQPMVEAMEKGELQVEHRFKPGQPVHHRMPKSRSELLMLFRQATKP